MVPAQQLEVAAQQPDIRQRCASITHVALIPRWDAVPSGNHRGNVRGASHRKHVDTPSLGRWCFRGKRVLCRNLFRMRAIARAGSYVVTTVTTEKPCRCIHVGPRRVASSRRLRAECEQGPLARRTLRSGVRQGSALRSDERAKNARP
jgi:hypothetical protein